MCAGEFIIGRVINLHASEGNLVPGFHYFEERGGERQAYPISATIYRDVSSPSDGERTTTLLK